MSDEQFEALSLTPREIEWILLSMRGLSYGEIATEMRIEVATVKKHARFAMKKLKLKTTLQVVVWGFENEFRIWADFNQFAK